MNMCVLCGLNVAIENSHVVPKFVYRLMKNASPVKTLRHSNEPNRPVQDGTKRPYLCVQCESKFSKWETYFCNSVYHPVLSGANGPVKYDERLGLFLASAFFRYLLHLEELHPGVMDENKAGLASLLPLTRSICRAAQLGPDPVFQYVVFLKPVLTPDRWHPPGINSYNFFSTDGILLDVNTSSGNRINFFYWKIPYLCGIVAESDLSVLFSDPDALREYRVAISGSVNPKANGDPLLLLVREEMALRALDMQRNQLLIPSAQQAKIIEEIESSTDPDKSERHRIHMLDMALLRKQEVAESGGPAGVV